MLKEFDIIVLGAGAAGARAAAAVVAGAQVAHVVARRRVRRGLRVEPDVAAGRRAGAQ